MTEVTPAAACQLCGGPVSKRNVVGFCNQSQECRKAARRAHFDRWYTDNKDVAAARWSAWYSENREQRAVYKKEYRQDPANKASGLAYTQAFKADPENAERVRGYNRRGRQRYMARDDRPCLHSGGCDEFAKVGNKFCPEHIRIESNWSYHRTAEARRQALAERQEWICPWCSQYLPSSLSRTHVDHVIPRASGLVIEEDWNFQLLHGRCNQQKSDRITAQAVALAAEHGLVLAAGEGISGGRATG
jgi:5-methylcytosine-specific restriction endonuclease McrA